MSWILKVLLLLAGAFLPVLGLPLIFLDGLFHTFTPEAGLREQSPDWIIARNAWGGEGFSETVHKAMGVFLLSSSAWVFYQHFLVETPSSWWMRFYLKGIMPITLLIIALAIVLKAVYGGYSSEQVAFL